MLCEYHCHTNYSFDADTPMETMVLQAIAEGLDEICFTDHVDFSSPQQEISSIIDYEAYTKEFFALREKYQFHIQLKLGVEMGLETEMEEKTKQFLQTYPFDFVLGSTHNIHFQDIVWPSFYKGKSQQQYYETYFQAVLDHAKMSSCYDVVGHMDYCIRYGPWEKRELDWNIQGPLLQEILKEIIVQGKGLELNTSGKRYGLKDFNPSKKIVTLYKDLGGEIITLGSDSHTKETLGYEFREALSLLKEVGFRYYTRFEKRNPIFEKIAL